jgi:hypothetical protein
MGTDNAQIFEMSCRQAGIRLDSSERRELALIAGFAMPFFDHLTRIRSVRGKGKVDNVMLGCECFSERVAQRSMRGRTRILTNERRVSSQFSMNRGRKRTRSSMSSLGAALSTLSPSSIHRSQSSGDPGDLR